MTPAEVAQGMLAAALEAWDAGLAPIPVRMDFTKRPALEKWNGRTHERFARAEVERLFAEPRALAIVCGAASGGLEMLEVEDVVVQEGNWQRLFDSWPEELRQRVCGGYLEFSPSGGIHVAYRVEGMDVPGNTKLARRPRTDLAPSACDTLIETRGWGGYFVAAPSPGEAHESGNAWELHSGGFGSIATITAEERETLVGAARVFDEMPPETARSRAVVRAGRAHNDAEGLRPGEDFDARHTCGEVLERNGWTVVRRRGDEVMWCRPGKSAREGHSGIEHLDEPNRFVNWSSSTTLEVEQGYSAFALCAHLEHGGDFSAAARELGKAGYGEQAQTRERPLARDQSQVGALEPTEIVVGHQEPEQGSPNGHEPAVVMPPEPFPLEAFPPDVIEFVEQTCRSVCCSPEMLAPIMLSVAGTLIGKRRSLGFKWDWQEYANVWTLVVAPTGQKKSPAFKRATKAVGPAQERLRAQYEAAMREYEDTPQTKGAVAPDEPYLLVKDVTVEAFAECLSLHPRGVILARDELGGWGASHGQYKPGGKGDDRQKWLEWWSRDDLVLKRKGKPAIVVPDPFVVVTGGIQPTAVPDLQRQGVDDGMCERFLMAEPPYVAPEADTPAVDRAVAEWWRDVGLGLYDLPGADGDQLMPTEEGRAALIREVQALYDDRPERGSPGFGAWCKADAQLLRVGVVLAELWHVCAAVPEVASPEVAERAGKVVRWFLGQAETVMDAYGSRAQRYDLANPALERRVVAWLDKQGSKTITRRVLMTYGPLQGMKVKDADEVLGTMLARGVIRFEAGSRKDSLVVKVDHGE